MKEGHIFTDGEISPDYHLELKRQIAALPSDTEKIIHHITSPGGSVYGGYKGFHALKLAGLPIHSVIEGEAQSMATIMPYAGDTVEILNPSVFMIHCPSQGAEGTAATLAGSAAELQKIEDEMAQIYASKTKLPLAKILELMKAQTSMTATEAKQYGFVDSVTNHLKAVAKGKSMNPQKKKTLMEGVTKLAETIGLLQPPTPPATAIPQPPPPDPMPAPVPPKPAQAMDIPLQDGTTLTSDAVSEDTVNGSNVTFNGQPANGDYTAADGTVITCVQGVVTNVVDPMDAANKALADAQAKVAELQANQTKIATDKAATEAEAAKIKDTLDKTAKMLAEVKEQLEKTIGDDNAPDTGMIANKAPFAIAKNSPTALGINMSQRFIAQEFPWLEEHYERMGKSTAFFKEYRNQGPVMTSIVQTNFNFTYPGILTTDILYKPSIDTPAISEMFTIDQNIKFQKQYNLVQVLNQILKPYNGCGPTAGNSNNDKVNIINATVLTKEFRMEESWCKDDFTQQLTGVYNNLAQEWLKTGEAQFDPAGTPMDSVIQEVLTDALRRDVFGRLTMAAGNSSNANFNQIDGLWDRLIDSSGASNYCVLKASGAALGIGTPTAAAAVAALEAAYIQSSIILKQQLNKAVYWVTGSIYDAYVNQIIGTGNVSQAQYEAFINGVQGNKTWDGGITYKGIPLRPVRYWDSSLADPNNPLFATTRNLILLTIKQNHIAGIENGADLNKIYSWYENKDSKRYYRADMKLGYNYLHCDLQTIYI